MPFVARFGRLKFLTCLVSLLCFDLYVWAQKKVPVEIIHSDVLEIFNNNGQTIKKISGNVQLKHEGLFFQCDSALIFDTPQLLNAYGNVIIRQGDTIYFRSDSLIYQGTPKILDAYGNVLMETPDIRLTTPHLTYDRNNQTAYYFESGEIIGKKDPFRLSSQIGLYFGNGSYFRFGKNVKVVKNDISIETDTLLYFEKEDRYVFQGKTYMQSPDGFVVCEKGFYWPAEDKALYQKNVSICKASNFITGDSIAIDQKKRIVHFGPNFFFIDTVEKAFMHAHKGVYYLQDDSMAAYINPCLGYLTDDDTLWIKGDTVLFKLKSSTDSLSIKNHSTIDSANKNDLVTFWAFPDAAIYSEDLSGKSDSLFYASNDSLLHLIGSPVLWMGEMEIYADTIVAFFYDTIMQNMLFYENTYLSQWLDSASFNMMYGVYGRLVFHNNQPAVLYLDTAAEAIYHVKDDDGKKIGINHSHSQNIKIYFKEKELSKVVLQQNPQGIIDPPLKEELKILEGWKNRREEKIYRNAFPLVISTNECECRKQ